MIRDAEPQLMHCPGDHSQISIAAQERVGLPTPSLTVCQDRPCTRLPIVLGQQTDKGRAQLVAGVNTTVGTTLTRTIEAIQDGSNYRLERVEDLCLGRLLPH